MTSDCDVTNSAHQKQMTTMPTKWNPLNETPNESHLNETPYENLLRTPLMRLLVVHGVADGFVVW